MAKIIYKNNHIKEELEVYTRKEKLYKKIVIALAILFIPTGGLTLIPFFITSAIYNKNSKRASILRSGLEGEEKASKVFSKLSDDYYVLSDLEVIIDDKTSQIDNVVVGSNGIFVIETKNLNGTITGEESDKEILQEKIGVKGGRYSKKFYNPIKQVNTHVYRVSEVIKRNKLNKWVQGVVYFTNKNCSVNIKSNNVPVFSSLEEGDKEIINYIANYDNGIIISGEDKIKIVNIMKEFLMGNIIENNETNLERRSNISSMTNNYALQCQQEMMNREFMEFTQKGVTSFDEGGFIQGAGFNLSDTMANEMNSMMEHNF